MFLPVAILDYRIWKSATATFDPLREPLITLDAQTLAVFIARPSRRRRNYSMLISRPPSQVRFLSLHLPFPFFFLLPPPFLFAFHSTLRLCRFLHKAKSLETRPTQGPPDPQLSLSLSKGILILHRHRLKRSTLRSSSPDNEVCKSTLTSIIIQHCGIGQGEIPRCRK